jgi:hypothetical protein
MGEMTREELSAMNDPELLAYEREHHGDEADTPHPQAPPFRPSRPPRHILGLPLATDCWVLYQPMY